MKFHEPPTAHKKPFSRIIHIRVPTRPEFDYTAYVQECVEREAASYERTRSILSSIRDTDYTEEKWQEAQERRREAKERSMRYYLSLPPADRLLREVVWFIKEYTTQGGIYADEHIRIRELMVGLLKKIKDHLIAGRDEEAFYALYCISGFVGLCWEEETAEDGYLYFWCPSDLEWYTDQWADVEWRWETCIQHTDVPVAPPIAAPSGHLSHQRECAECLAADAAAKQQFYAAQPQAAAKA